MDSVVDTLQGQKGMCALVREYAAYLRDAQSTNSGTLIQSEDEDVSPLAFNALVAPVATGRRGKDQSQRSLVDVTLSTDISECHLAAGPDIQQAMMFFQAKGALGAKRLVDTSDDGDGSGSASECPDDSETDCDDVAGSPQDRSEEIERPGEADKADGAAPDGVSYPVITRQCADEHEEPADWIDDTGPEGLSRQEQEAYENQDSDSEDVGPESTPPGTDPEQRQSKDTVAAAYIMQEILVFVVWPWLLTYLKASSGHICNNAVVVLLHRLQCTC
jgi:hypothetical protein